MEVRWGDAEAANQLLQMIAQRQQLGDLLAEGVKRASERLGGPAAECAIYTMKGATPRGHDHRGTLGGDARHLHRQHRHDGGGRRGEARGDGAAGAHQSVRPRCRGQAGGAAAAGGAISRIRSGTCIFTTRTRIENLCRARQRRHRLGLHGGGGAALRPAYVGDLLRAFNLRCGIGPDLEKPSKRYGSTPLDGPAKGQSVGAQWEKMVDTWYAEVGYDRKTGKPLPKTLKALGLDWLAKELWGARA